MAADGTFDWEAGFWGMMWWGVPSSIVLISAPSLPTWGSSFALIVLIGLPTALFFATIVWGLGGLCVALPLWAALVAFKLRGRTLRMAMIVLGALVVGTIWMVGRGFAGALIASGGIAGLLGALSGALGGYGFCRSAMRS